MPGKQTETIRWRKSSFSGADGQGACVEVALTDQVLVRDSKNPAGPRLAFGPSAWDRLVTRMSRSGIGGAER